jgi:hypothetical protein
MLALLVLLAMKRIHSWWRLTPAQSTTDRCRGKIFELQQYQLVLINGPPDGHAYSQLELRLYDVSDPDIRSRVGL